jgi:hypothetical protein
MIAILIIPGALKPIAEQAVQQLSPASEGETFSIGLIPAGAGDTTPPTHWACMPGVDQEALGKIAFLVASPPFAGVSHLVSCEITETLAQFSVLCDQLQLKQRPDPATEHRTCPTCGQPRGVA